MASPVGILPYKLVTSTENTIDPAGRPPGNWVQVVLGV